MSSQLDCREHVPVAARWSHCIGPDGTGAEPAAGTAPIGIIRGEGIGGEVLGVVTRAIEALRDACGCRIVVEALDPSSALMQGTDEIGAEVLSFCRAVFARRGAILAGPVGGRFVYRLRRELDLFCKLVPLRGFPELAGAMRLKGGAAGNTDILLVRDNAGGLYQGAGAIVADGRGGRVAEHRFAYAASDIARIVAVAAAVASRRRRRLHVIVKDGGVLAASALWREVSTSVAAAEGVEVVFLNIDFAAYELLNHPGHFDVIVAPNMFGDILADLGGLLMGARGNTFSGNFAPSRRAVYQTNHGAAQDLAGRDVANPVGQVLALAMLLHESFGMAREAGCIEGAVRDAWSAGWRTADLAEPGCRIVGTRQFGSLIVEGIMQQAGILS
jgi:3-isopropylmalate dehydrogenase